MQGHRLIRKFCFLLLISGTLASAPNILKASRKFINQCLHLEENPHFIREMVLGTPWRIYHTWNWQLESPEQCVDITFKNATREVINRIYTEMSEYMLTQPPWNEATLVMTMGRDSHELLLFNDMNEGKFLAVPNIVRDSASMTPEKKSVPFLHLSLQIVYSGKFLLMLDCNLGIVTLSSKTVPYASEVGSAVDSLHLGNGLATCTHNRPADEILGMTPEKNSVPFLHFSLQIYANKFLVMLDCNLGIVTLSSKGTPYRSEVGAAVDTLDLGTGFVACSHDRLTENFWINKDI